jgi:plasmid stability protein
MPSLQIRDLPDAIYRALSLRALRERRSLAQQAVIELERIAEVESKNRRLESLRDLRESIQSEGERKVSRAPAEIVREDRDR